MVMQFGLLNARKKANQPLKTIGMFSPDFQVNGSRRPFVFRQRGKHPFGRRKYFLKMIGQEPYRIRDVALELQDRDRRLKEIADMPEDRKAWMIYVIQI